MKLSKKVISLLLSVLLLVSLLPVLGISATAANSYTINGKTFDYTTYSAYGANCWQYAWNLYKYIWGSSFTSYRTENTNYLRNLSAADLTISADHLQKYISKAPLGSVLRFSSSATFNSDDNDGLGHSAILVGKSATGFTVCEGGYLGTCHEGTLSFTEAARQLINEGKEYIKYIKWPGGTDAYTGSSSPEVTVIGSGETVTILSGSNNTEKAWNFLKGQGFNEFGCAGIIGNLYCESGVNPKNLQNNYEASLGYTDDSYTAAVDNGTYAASRFAYDKAGYGIAQWTYFSRKQNLYNFAKSRYTSVGDLETQLIFLVSELDSYGLTYYLKNASSVFEASNIMLLQFEKPWNQSVDNQNYRAAVSQGFYDTYSTEPLTYKVSYDACGGSNAPATQYKQPGVDLTLSSQVPTKPGYVFCYWSATVRTGNTEHYLFMPIGQTNVYKYDTDVVFEAVYQQSDTDGKYVLKFNLNGGIGTFPTQYKTPGVSITIPERIPSRDGYSFLKWSYSYSYGAGGGFGSISPGATYSYEGNADFTAEWGKNYNVTVFAYSADGSDNVVTFDFKDDHNSVSNVSYYNNPKSYGVYGLSYWDDSYEISNIRLNGACKYELEQGALKGDVSSDVNVIIKSVPHSYNGYTVIKEATATSTGIKRYHCTVCNQEHDEETPMLVNPFKDVQSNAYYYSSVLWAVDSSITSGTTRTTFDPEGICTRSQIVSFLWRAAGSPEPKSLTNKFTDVSASAWYYKAVLWAVENGITSGTSATTFAPNKSCTRAEAVTFLWRANGTPSASFNNKFTDISYTAYYTQAVLWAVENGITSGVSANKFSPNGVCTRAQIVCFLDRTY